MQVGLGEGAAPSEAGIVHQIVDLDAEASHLVVDARRRSGLAEIGWKDMGPDAVRRVQLARERIESLTAPCHEHGVVPVAREQARELGAQAGGRSGDQCSSHVADASRGRAPCPRAASIGAIRRTMLPVEVEVRDHGELDQST